jgi:hypothetical protein
MVKDAATPDMFYSFVVNQLNTGATLFYALTREIFWYD